MKSKVEPLLRCQGASVGQEAGFWGMPPGRVRVLVGFAGSTATIEQSPLAVEFIGKRTVIGSIDLADIDALAQLDSVVSISADHPLRPQLDRSVPEINVGLLRSAHPELTGEGVIVGIIDSGIDIFHHAFRWNNGTSRILSILDLTLPPYRISVTQNPTGGTFRLVFSSEGQGPTPTGPIPFQATKEHVQTALQNLPVNPRIGAGDVEVTGGPLPHPIVVNLVGQYAQRDTSMTADSSALLSIGGRAKVQVGTDGREFSASDIAAALGDEKKPFPHRDTLTHGTHVAGIAVGDGSQAGTTPSGDCGGRFRYVGVAPKADLIVVKAREVSMSIRGVNYIFDKAQHAGGRPVVINMSLGSQLGAHDGTDELEQELDHLLEGSTGKVVVVGAGNKGDGSRHASGKVIGNGPPTSIEVRVPPQKTSDQIIDVWHGGSGQLQVRVLQPPPSSGGLPSPEPMTFIFPNPDPNAEPDVHNITGYGRILVLPLFTSPLNKRRIRVILTPPQPQPQPTPSNPAPVSLPIHSGTWTIQLIEGTGTDTEIDCWTDCFDGESAKIMSGDRARTVEIPGTAHNVITVGSYDPRDGTLEDTSAHGPTTDVIAPRIKPDICAPGVGIAAPASGTRSSMPACCQCCSTFYIFASGTSQAAPHVTGVVALMLQHNPTLSFEEIRNILEETARPPFPDFTHPDNNWGAGKVDALDALLATPLPPTPTLAEGGKRDAPQATLTEDAGPDAVHPLALASPVATWPRLLDELGRLQQELAGRPRLALLAALVSTHFDEVVRLVNSNRRVAARWHRMGGPALISMGIDLLAGGSAESALELAIPESVEGRPLAERLRRLLDVLARYGSARLRADIQQHGPMLLALPGRRLADLDLPSPGGA